MKPYHLIIFILFTVLYACSPKDKQTFSFSPNHQGVELTENGKRVFFYQREPKSLDGRYICSNYIHPLYSLSGDTITEEFPVDHPFHRGVFWAWHQIFLDGKSLGDGWIMENISQNVTDVQTSVENGSARMKVMAVWKSPLAGEKPFLNEMTTITVHPLRNKVRRIDFSITLSSLLPGLEIGGSDDEKGYGGFCTRIKLPADLIFTSSQGEVTPQITQIKAGPWMDISGKLGKGLCGITILCHPETPDYPQPWILRSVTSMQNIVFPGRERISIDPGAPVTLYYRLLVHEGNAKSIDLESLQNEYSRYDPKILPKNPGE